MFPDYVLKIIDESVNGKSFPAKMIIYATTEGKTIKLVRCCEQDFRENCFILRQ